MKRFYIIIDSRGDASERLRTDVNPPVANRTRGFYVDGGERSALEKAL